MARARTNPNKKADFEDSKKLEDYRDISDDVIESDFVPYACLYDPNSIATKDGELLQTIKITGLGYSAGAQVDLRQAIRYAIRTLIPGEEYAVWLHTLRRHRSLVGHAHFPDKFSGQLDEAWRAQHPASVSFVNELYITIVRAGPDSSLRDPRKVAQSLLYKRTRDERMAALDAANREINATVASILEHLRPFGARLLTLVEREGVFYSEQLEFLEKLINLEERPMPVPLRDLSHVLTSGEITFGFNAMEVRSADGHRRFAAILTLKEYKEATLAGIDKFLDIPCEIIVTQCFDFIGAEQARESYETQDRYLTMSGDKELRQWTEIDRLMQSQGGRTFGQQQTSIFLIAPSISQLEANVRLTLKAMSRLGMVILREDLHFEDCYWAQLPGNFTFISRKHSIDTEHLAGFANLQTAPMGNPAGSPWGPAVSLFTTLQDKPYFFNFHRDSLLHTLILGRGGSGRTTFTHFLLAQARKLNPRIWYLDGCGRSGPFVQALGGEAFVPGAGGCGLNPLQLPETPANREFLALFLSTLVDPTGAQLNAQSLPFYQTLVELAWRTPREQRRLSALLPSIAQADPAVAKALSRYCENGEFGPLFDAPQDRFVPSDLVAWDISKLMGNDATRVPLTSYLLHRLTAALDGKPTLFVMAGGYALLDNPLFGPRAGGWCDFLAQNNTALIFGIPDVEQNAQYGFASAIASRAATIFAFADGNAGAEYIMGYGLSESDLSSVAYIDRHHRQMLMKRGTETHVLKMALSGLGETALSTLSVRTAPPPPQRSAADLLADLMGFGEKAAG